MQMDAVHAVSLGRHRPTSVENVELACQKRTLSIEISFNNEGIIQIQLAKTVIQVS